METTKKLRSRTRSSNIFPEPVPETKPEEAPVEETNKANTNLNGENVENAEPQKDADKTEATVSETAEPENTLTNEEIVPEAPKENETVQDKEPSKPEESTVKTRKRKANEMKTGDETDESSIEKKSNIEVNPAVTTETIESENTETSEVKADVLEEPPTLVINEEVEIKTDKDDSMIESDITLPPKQTLGKGKRARIPNKRYSDILLSPHHKPKIENGSDNELSISHDLNVVAPERKPRNVSSSPATPPLQYKKNKTASDVTDPNFLKPFELGWKRELVWRATYDAQAAKRSGDIYYYNPMGKKYRSMREIADALKGKDLTLDNFTFTKEAIGLDDPEKEIIREAKFKAGPGLQKKVLTKKTVPAKAQTPSKVSSPKLASPKVTSPKANTPKNDVAKGNTRSVATKAKAPAKKGEKRKSEEDVEAEAVPAKTSPVAVRSTRGSAKWSNFNSEKPCQPCSIRCPGVQGFIPTLQCRHCLCLYHHECVGIAPHLAMSYVCKNCQNTSPSVTPTPPINRLTRLEDELIELPSLPPPQPLAESKSLVGSVMSWLPHNSKIVDNIQRGGNVHTDTLKPQYLEILAGRKFLVIPKHNFMTISPSVAATANQNEVENVETLDSASLGPIAVEEVKVEPQSPSKPENANTADQDTTQDEKPEPAPESPPKPKKRLAYKVNNTVAISDKTDNKFMDHYLQNLSYGYNTLLYVFQYLKVQDLLRAGCVCTMWRDIASHALLWRTVRMKNSQVHSFDGLANTLRKHGTNHLDLRKMLLPSGGDEIWPQFSKAIERVDTLRKIELCRCPASVVEQLAVSNPDLEVINAVTIKCESMTLEPFANLKSIKELRLKSTGGLTLSSNIDSLKGLTTLKHLSLTSIKELHSMNLSVIAELTNLESLDLGECSDFPKNFGEDILVKLVNLEKLRLEKGQGNCHTFEILEAVKDMKRLEQLELVNFDIKTGFDNALGACSNIKKLLIIPTYISQSATTNHMVLGGVLRLHKTLSHFVWGVTLELLRVTELFVDQCEEPNAKEKKEKKPTGNGDSIPVLKPVPLITENDNEIPPAFEPPQVEILPLPNLQKLLLQSLPTTRVKILKIPFHATWRQSITDSVN